jgi:hypothetical protein
MPGEKPPIDFNPPADPKLFLQFKKMDLESQRLARELGWIGKVIGSGDNAHTNLAALVIVAVLTAGVVVSFTLPNDRLEFWKVIILPVLTLTLGYVLGRKSGTGGPA